MYPLTRYATLEAVALVASREASDAIGASDAGNARPAAVYAAADTRTRNRAAGSSSTLSSSNSSGSCSSGSSSVPGLMRGAPELKGVVLFNGTNLDDRADSTRVGLVAAADFNVASPLDTLTKDEV